jgi:hypothetical protein
MLSKGYDGPLRYEPRSLRYEIEYSAMILRDFHSAGSRLPGVLTTFNFHWFAPISSGWGESLHALRKPRAGSLGDVRALFVSMKQIARRKSKSPSTAIHLDQHQSLWAATNALNAAVHIPTHESISGGMCLHALADCEVVLRCGRRWRGWVFGIN